MRPNHISRTNPVRLVAIVISLLSGLSSPKIFADSESNDDVASLPRLLVYPERVNPVDKRLFGQFMERATWGEPGYDAARDPEHPNDLRAEVVALMKEMSIPVIRFPGGTDIKQIRWMDMIDNAPGRAGPRPVFRGVRQKDSDAWTYTNLFGWDELFALCQELNAQPLPVLNFYQGFSREIPLEQAALEAAGLIAYANAPLGADLPSGMPDWPSIRARNGHAEPYNVKLAQLSNESWFYFKQVMKKAGMEEAPWERQADRYANDLLAYIRAIRAVDPDIELIMDGQIAPDPAITDRVLSHPEIREAVRYAAVHLYGPWDLKHFQQDGQKVDIADLSPRAIWYRWAGAFNFESVNGLSAIPAAEIEIPLKYGYEIAVTEWNWNGWWSVPSGQPQPALDSWWAKAVGAAGLLHAMMREGEYYKLACQSMLVGINWGIRSISVSSDGFPEITPTGKVTAFYSQNHGKWRLNCALENWPVYDQIFQAGTFSHTGSTAFVDSLVTADENTIFIHLINRRFIEDSSLEIDLKVLSDGYSPNASLLTLMGSLMDSTTEHAIPETWIEEKQISIAPKADQPLILHLPPRSVSVLKIRHSHASLN